MTWPEGRVREMVHLFNGYPFDSALFSVEGDVPLVRIRDLSAQDFETYLPAPVPAQSELKDGDLIIGMDGEFNTCIWTRGPAALNQRLCGLRPKPGIDIRWVAYNLPPHLKFINETQYATTVKHLSSGEVLAIRFPVPPHAEQVAICDFLDRETSKVDALIAKQEQLIGTLREDRTAAVTYAVTEGLDPNVEKKDSGVEWLGDIPRHWQLVPIKHVVRRVGVGLVINPSTYVADSGVPFLLGRNVRDGWIDLMNVNYMSEEDSRRLKASRLNAGDVVVVRAGYPGRAAVVPPDLDGANCASILILREPTLARPDFVEMFFNSLLGRSQVKLAQYGAAQEQINVGDVVNFLMPVPPLSEQQEIIQRIAAKTGAIDSLIDKAADVINSLHEYRSALITDAVTGKLDVRGVA